MYNYNTHCLIALVLEAPYTYRISLIRPYAYYLFQHLWECVYWSRARFIFEHLEQEAEILTICTRGHKRHVWPRIDHVITQPSAVYSSERVLLKFGQKSLGTLYKGTVYSRVRSNQGNTVCTYSYVLTNISNSSSSEEGW